MGHMRRPSAASLVVGSLAAPTLGTMLVLNPPPAVRHPPSPAASGLRARATKETSDTAGGITSDVDGSAGQAIDPALFSPGACLAFAPTSNTSNTSNTSSNTSGDRHET